MLQDGDRVWFFKVVGPAQPVTEGLEGVRTLLTSVTLTGGQDGPTWELPETWTQKPPSGMRFATIDIPTSQGTLELTVTPLRAVGDYQEYVVANVNRWRQQLGLAPTTGEQLFDATGTSGELSEVQGRAGESLLLVDLTGDPETGLANEMTGPAARPSIGPEAGGIVANPATDLPGEAGLTYQSPSNWVPGRLDAMRKAAFEIRDGAGRAEMTVIPLAAGSGDLLSNINRWRDQVGLGPIDGAGLPGQMKDFEVDGAPGHYVEMLGPSETPGRESIIGVICPRGDLVWYFKLKGDATLVERERDSFQAFVRSVKFAGQDGADHGP